MPRPIIVPKAAVILELIGLALFVEFTFEPPFWVHVILWVPLILILALGLLRPLKGFLIAQQYRHKAEPGRIDTA